MSNVLLATPLYASHHDAGHFWLRALTSLGHEVTVWDYRLDEEPPPGPMARHPDTVLVMKGESLYMPKMHRLFPSARFICYWPDKFEREPGILDRLLAGYDQVFSPVRPTPDRVTWLPTGWDPKIHAPAFGASRSFNYDSVYVGTSNSQYKVDMVREITPSVVFGNDWWRKSPLEWGLPAVGMPIYGAALASCLNRARVAVDIHQSPETGVNRKFFEMMACTFTIVDDVPGVREILGEDLFAKVAYKTATQARDLIAYYRYRDTERDELWQQERAAIAPYTYEAAVRRICGEDH